jgi:hypothetical protein
MNRTIRRLMMLLGIIAITAGSVLLIRLIVTYAPWLIVVFCVGLLLTMIWLLTDHLI